LPTRATAAAKSIAPKTSIRGGGANEFTNTLSSSPRRSPCAPYLRIPVSPWASMPRTSSSTAASSLAPEPSVPDAPVCQPSPAASGPAWSERPQITRRAPTRPGPAITVATATGSPRSTAAAMSPSSGN
jgi:hypothetical protein